MKEYSDEFLKQHVTIANAELEWMDFEEYQKDGGKSYKRNQIISQVLKND